MRAEAPPQATPMQALQTLFDLERWADVVQTGSPMLGTAADAAVHVLVSQALSQLERHPAAHHVAQQALARWPTDADACLATVNAELALGLHAQAERQARAGLRHAPDDARLVAVLGRALLALGQLQAAHAQFVSALELNPEAAYYRYLRAIALWNLGQHDHARSMLDQALAIDPLNADYLELRATLERHYSTPRAQQLARQALRLNPRLPGAQRLLRWLATQHVYGFWGMSIGWMLNAWAQWGPQVTGLQGFAVVVGAGMALSLAAKFPAHWLWGYCAVHALVISANSTQGLPALLQTQGMRALLTFDALAFGLGCGVMTVCLVVLATMARWLVWSGLCNTCAFAHSLWVARQDKTTDALLRDLLQRPRVQFNVVVGVMTTAGAIPPVPMHITVLWHAFVLVPVLWVLAKWRLPAEQQPSFSVLWWMLGLCPAIVCTMSNIYLRTATPAAHWAFACALGVYATILAHQAQEL